MYTPLWVQILSFSCKKFAKHTQFGNWSPPSGKSWISHWKQFQVLQFYVIIFNIRQICHTERVNFISVIRQPIPSRTSHPLDPLPLLDSSTPTTPTKFYVQFWSLFHEQDHLGLLNIPFDRQSTRCPESSFETKALNMNKPFQMIIFRPILLWTNYKSSFLVLSTCKHSIDFSLFEALQCVDLSNANWSTLDL